MALILIVLVFLLTQFAGGIFVSLYPVISGWSAERADQWLSSSTTAQFIYVFIVEALTVAALYWFVRSHKLSFKSLGLVRPRWRDPGIALLAVPVYLGMYLAAVTAVQFFFPSIDLDQEQQIGFQAISTRPELVMVFLSLVILPPFVEELVVRGFLFSSFRKTMRFVYAAVLSSLIFAAAHLEWGSGAPLLWVAGVDTFALAMVLAYMRERTGSLWPGIILHALKNGTAFFMIFILGVH